MYQPLLRFIPFHFLSLFCLLVLVLVLVLLLLLLLLFVLVLHFLWVLKTPPVAYKRTQLSKDINETTVAKTTRPCFFLTNPTLL